MLIREMPYQALETLTPAPPYVLLKSGHVTAQERWSFLGWDPWLAWTPFDDVDPLAGLDRIIATARAALPATPTACPVPCVMGALSYDLGFYIESIRASATSEMMLPTMVLYAFRQYLVVDEFAKQAWQVTLSATPHASVGPPLPTQATPFAPTMMRNFSCATYCDAVATIRQMIAQGDCYQVNLSQRFVVPSRRAARDLFVDALQRNPAAMMALVDTGTFQLVSTSPERLVRRHGDICVSEPIKGTAARGRDPHTDAQARAQLLGSEKNRAELAMIVDLIRNDLGRVADIGSVQVDDPCRVESYANVHHLVATVSARVRPHVSWGDVLRALFPGGSVTGCPKIQAMHVIENIERVRRHFYCGSIGYIDAQGGGDWNIAIRTLTTIADHAIFHLGGGVVYDSDPLAEYEETLRKGETLFDALQVAPEDIMSSS